MTTEASGFTPGARLTGARLTGVDAKGAVGAVELMGNLSISPRLMAQSARNPIWLHGRLVATPVQ
jgi:hypothetical protein